MSDSKPKWRHGEQPPVGARIMYASSRLFGIGEVAADQPPFPAHMWWCYADEAREALGVDAMIAAAKEARQ